MLKRQGLVVFAILAVFAIFLSFTCSAAAAGEIRIGVLAPFHAVAGEGIIQASKLAAEEINKSGGIKGEKIKLFIRDSEINPEKAIAAFKKLVFDDKVVACLGIYSSGVTAALQPYMSRYKIPFIGSASASPTLTQKVAQDYKRYKYYFRLMNHAHRENRAILGFVKDIVKGELGLKKMAIISEQAKWAEDFVPFMTKHLNDMGLETVFSTYFDIKTKDFSPIFAKINASGAEFIIDNIAIAPGEIITKAWFEAKAPPVAGVNVSAMRSDYWKKTEGKCLGEITYILGGFNIPITGKTIPFWDRYKEKYGMTPQYTAFYSYDAMYILADSIARAKSLKGDDIVKAIEAVKITGATGLIEWDKAHDPIEGIGRPSIYMLQWQGAGEPKILWPKNVANGQFMFPPWKTK